MVRKGWKTDLDASHETLNIKSEILQSIIIYVLLNITYINVTVLLFVYR